MSPVRHDYVLTRLGPLAECTPEPFLVLEQQALHDLEAEGFAASRRQLSYLIDLRYEHQGYELSVPVPWPALVPDELRARFDATHEHLYGHAAPNQPVEVVSYRVVGTGQISAPRLARLPAHDTADTCVGQRQVFFSGLMTCPIYDRARLGTGSSLDGPAIVEQYDSTIVVPPELRLRVDGYGNAILERR
jgi:N-methylhydantoinase A